MLVGIAIEICPWRLFYYSRNGEEYYRKQALRDLKDLYNT